MLTLTYTINKEDCSLFPHWILNLQSHNQLTHEEPEDLTIHIASQQRIPALSLARYCCDDIDLCAELLVSSGVSEASTAPSLLVKVRLLKPAFIDIDDSFTTIVNF